jgi:Membrane domain of glycerophosphoryl diester phosphodiesterase
VQPTAAVAPLDLRRPRNLGDLLSTTFSLYGRHFAVFASIAFAVVIPLDAIFYGVMLGQFGSYDSTPPPGTQLIATYTSLLIAQPLITAMHVAAVMAISEGRKPTLSESFVRGGDVFLAVLGALLLSWFFTILGFIALIIPGIYILVRLCVVAPSVVVEGHRGMGAIRRSWDLVKDNWWRIFGILIVVGIIGGLAGGILYIPGALIAEETGSGPIALAAQILVDAVTYSFQALTATLIFFDLKARREGAPPPGWYQQPPPPPPGGWQPPPPPPPESPQQPQPPQPPHPGWSPPPPPPQDPERP